MSTSTSRVVRCALVLVIAIGCVGCGSAKHDSPQAVYDAAKVAVQAKDFQKFCGCLTPESQDLMAGGMVMAGVMMKGMAVGMGAMGGDEAKAKAEKKFAPVDEVLAKHGVSSEELEKEGENMDVQADPKVAMKKFSERIKDKPAFIGDMMKAMESLREDGQGGGPADEFTANLTDVKIEGDTASGTTAKPDAPDEKSPIHFKKVDGGWFIDLTPEMGG